MKVERLAICLSMADAKGMLLFSHLALKVFYDRPFYKAIGNFTKKERTWRILTYSSRVLLIDCVVLLRPVSFCTANTNEVSILTMSAKVKDLAILLV